MTAAAEALVGAAVTAGDAALLAAAARTGHPLPAAARHSVEPLAVDGLGIYTAGAHDQVVLRLSDDATADPDGHAAPPVLHTAKLRKALVGLLVATRSDDNPLPYPGRSAPVTAAVRATRPTSTQGARHILGALRTLAAIGYCELGRADGVDTIRPGPLLATWCDDWASDELPEALDGLIAT
jgi:hypothetical protein